MSDPCRSMRESKRKKTSDITLLRRKLVDADGTTNKSVQEDIYAAEQAIKQLRIDIKDCMGKNKKGKPKTEVIKLKPIEVSLNTATNEPSHGTGTRKQIS